MNDVNLTPDLRRLAELYGINQSYWEAGGTQHFLSERTLRQLLVGLGVLDSVDDSDSTIGQAVHAERQALWRAGLPTVAVLHELEAVMIELVIPTDKIDHIWHWSIETEDGERLDDTFTPGQLATSGDLDDIEGWANAHRTFIDDQELARFRLALPELSCGYHTLSIEVAGDSTGVDSKLHRKTRLIVAPARCYGFTDEAIPDAEVRLWGIAVQLYAVRSLRNWGIGDFTDLFNAVGVAAGLGANVVGINPLHALFLHEPEQASPYSPSSRLYLNPLYIDVELVDDFATVSVSDQSSSASLDDANLETLRNKDFVDYSAVAKVKLPVLEALFDAFTLNHLHNDSSRAHAFRKFQAQHGKSLQKYALFEALQEAQYNSADGITGDWHQWPEPLRNPDSDAVAEFAEKHSQRILFHTWLQWLAHEQLDKAATEAEARGMKAGLYRDLAVGVAGGGSDTWANPSLFVDRVDVGAPPDDFSAKGQNWGLPPMNPRALRESGFSLFIDILRKNMTAAGALRIDHVMGLMRIFCIPTGESPAEGAYMDYPIDELLAIVALESQRQKCIVIGEDLGTVPDGLRQKLHAADVLSYRLLYFEKNYDGDLNFRQPDTYPPNALVGANTHDLPTLRSFWSGADLALRETLDLFPDKDMYAQQVQHRARDRDRLLDALRNEALLSQDTVEEYRESGIMDTALVEAIHRYLARTRSLMLVANMEDMLGQEEQINLPGTDRDIYPNWRRKLPLALEDWLRHEPFCDCAAAINTERVSRS